MDLTSLIEDSLRQPKDALLFHLSRSLAQAFPDRNVLETGSWAFGLTAFRRDGLCQARQKSEVHSQLDWDWDPQDKREYREFRTAWLEISWEGQTLEAIIVSYQGAYRMEHRWYLLSESESLNRKFFRAVAEHTSEVRGEVLVFDGGCWQKSKDLFESIQAASWDNLILEGDLKAEIRGDLEGFFDAEDTYRRYGIPWKRGVLFLGPPGNGKTHTVKAIVGSIGRPCLYVKSLKSEHQTDHDLIGEVFHRARATAPCILVFEDLDALIDDENRSFFLNELDGFASNDGIVSVATTNHPEKLDPAILDRPSRFDRKYTFALPQSEERPAILSSSPQSWSRTYEWTRPDTERSPRRPKATPSPT